jgi:hypothetical protein
VPRIGYGLPTDTPGRCADTTVSPPISKAARHCALCTDTQRIVKSLRRTRELGVMMVCYRRAEACAATVCTEATARRVSAAPFTCQRVLV